MKRKARHDSCGKYKEDFPINGDIVNLRIARGCFERAHIGAGGGTCNDLDTTLQIF
jgi:hypothetical protein